MQIRTVQIGEVGYNGHFKRDGAVYSSVHQLHALHDLTIKVLVGVNMLKLQVVEYND
jgi:hypothetical protein